MDAVLCACRQMPNVVTRLAQLAYLPAIWFILSRKDCDTSAIKVGLSGTPLTSPEEQAEIQLEIAALQ